MKFRTTVLTAGKTTTGIEVPEEVLTALGGGGRPLVKVTINNYTYRSAIAKRGDRYMLGINADVREAANVAGGDVIDVELELDTEPREVTIHPELAKFLAAHPAAKEYFDSLSYSKKRIYTVPIEQAKTDETRQRHLDRAMKELKEGKK